MNKLNCNEDRKNELLEQWRAASSERERANFESSIYEMLAADGGKREDDYKHGMAFAVVAVTGQSLHITRSRRQLWLAGELAVPLWNEIDQRNMPIETAVKFLREARAAEKEKSVEAGKMLDVLIRLYQTWPLRRIWSRGKCIAVRVEPTDQKQKRKQKAQPPLPPPTPEDMEGEFWTKLRAFLRARMDEVVSEADAPRRDEIRREFETELESVLRRLQLRVNHSHNSLMGLAKVREPAVYAACELLSLDPPPRGKPVDLQLARKRQRQALRTLHPDAVGPGREEDFQAVCTAFELLTQYNEQIAARYEANNERV
jgi:hypothetical protein